MKRIAAPLLLALLTGGCTDDETTDPGPMPLDCASVATGQTLTGQASIRSGNDLDISINTSTGTFTQAPSVTNENGGTVSDVVVTTGTVQIAVNFGGGTSFTFDMDGRITGDLGDSCMTSRSFSVSVSGDTATVN